MEPLSGADAARLFIERATAAEPRFGARLSEPALVEELCRRLDGLPLAIELAAPYVRVLSVRELVAQLDRRLELEAHSPAADARHQTLRALIDWSYELLAAEEQRLFRRLSVFEGGWTLETAEAICSEGPDDGRELLTVLVRLVDKSLVLVTSSAGETRYGLLESLHHYAAGKLDESGEATALRGRHLRWFRDLAVRVQPATMGAGQTALYDRLEAELGNIRAALDWSATRPHEIEDGLRLAGELMRFWYVRGHSAEVENRLTALLELDNNAGLQPPNQGRAAALTALAFLQALQNRAAEAQSHAGEAVEIWRALGDGLGLASALWVIGRAARARGELECATVALEESLEITRQLRAQPFLSSVVRELGTVAYLAGESQRAEALFEEALGIGREEGGLRQIALAQIWLAALALDRGFIGEGTAAGEPSRDSAC